MDRILDWRGRQTLANERDACELDGLGRPIVRTTPPMAVMLHQTGCWFGVDKHRLRRHGGDEVAARHERGLEVNAHVTAMRHGQAVIAYSPAVYVQHGDVANSISVGLEHEGLYDVDGVPRGLPAGVDVGEIIEAGRAALSWLVETTPSLRLVIAHRQSRRPGGKRVAKTSDPGARIFREVGVEHGVRRLGLTIDPERVWGVGRPLPRDWYDVARSP